MTKLKLDMNMDVFELSDIREEAEKALLYYEAVYKHSYLLNNIGDQIKVGSFCWDIVTEYDSFPEGYDDMVNYCPLDLIDFMCKYAKINSDKIKWFIEQIEYRIQDLENE